MMECRNQQLVLEQIGNDHYFYNEAIKTLRTNIQFCGSGIQAVMFTSSLPDEGKSDTTFSLAQSFGSMRCNRCASIASGVPKMKIRTPFSSGAGSDFWFLLERC